MNETEEDRAYYGAAEAAFIARRGTPFLLSPKDFALLKEWRAIGIPIEAVEVGLDDAFTRREERGATGRVNSLSYCRDAILSAWERRAETSVGRGIGRAEGDPPDVAGALAGLSERLDSVARVHPSLTRPIESALRSLDRLARGAPPAVGRGRGETAREGAGQDGSRDRGENPKGPDAEDDSRGAGSSQADASRGIASRQ